MKKIILLILTFSIIIANANEINQKEQTQIIKHVLILPETVNEKKESKKIEKQKIERAEFPDLENVIEVGNALTRMSNK